MTVCRPFPWPLRLVLALVSGTGWSGAVLAAPITFNTALPVAKGQFIVREQAIVNQSGDDPSGADRDRTSRSLVSVLGYGVSPKLAVFGVLPYVHNELELTSGGARLTRSASGFGDLRAFGRYTVVQRDWPGKTFRLSPFFGIKAPTGEDNKSDALGRLPPSVQVGSGSWDAFTGLVATYQTLRYEVDSQLNFRANGEANDFEAGDVIELDGSLQYRLLPRKLTSGLPAFVYGVLEANLIHQDENRVGGSKDPNSGGPTLFLAPGIQYVTKRWIFEAAVQLPVSQNLNGTALENDFIARISVRAWGSQGRWNGQFHYPTDVAVSAQGEVFVADAYNHRIQRFTSEGDYLGKWGGIGYGFSGKWPGWFRLAKAVAVDAKGDVYVADAFNRRVQKFTPTGGLLAIWTGPRSGGEQLQYPAGVAAGPGGQVYVSDFFKDRIWKVRCR